MKEHKWTSCFRREGVVMSLEVGRKAISFIELLENRWCAMCRCSALDATIIMIFSAHQMAELMSKNRRPLQDIMPEKPPQLREIFISGTTPAEFDRNVIGQRKSNEFYEQHHSYFFGEVADY